MIESERKSEEYGMDMINGEEKGRGEEVTHKEQIQKLHKFK